MKPNRFANNFDFIRFLAAAGVMITHSYPLSGRPDHDGLAAVTKGLYTFSSLGVDVFFIISGYLIAKSIEQSPSLPSYFWRRVLRIFPALIVVVLLSVFILGPMVTTAPSPGAYFSHPYTYAYLWTISLYKISYFLPGVFGGNPYPYAVNGSLWTLPYEFTLYIALALLFLPAGRSPRILLVTLVAGLFLFRAYAQFSPGIFSMRNDTIAGMNMDYLLHFTTLFGAGSILNCFKDHIPLNKKIFLAAAAVLLLSTVLTEMRILKYIALPYAVIFLALLKSRLNQFGKYGDFSYGMYIYAFPVQQTIAYLWGRQGMPVALMACLSIACTLPFAVLSWKLVESKALRLKDRIGLPAIGKKNRGVRVAH